MKRMYSAELEYDRNIRLAAILALLALIAGFGLVRLPEPAPYQLGQASVIELPFVPLPVDMPEVPRVRPVPRQLVAAPDGKPTDPSIGQHDFNDFVRTVTDPVLEPVPFWKVEVKPEALDLPTPVYPELARQVGFEGTVVVKVLVDTAGAVARVEVLKGSGNSLLDAEAVRAAMDARFKPGRQRDRPVPVWVAVPYVFKLD